MNAWSWLWKWLLPILGDILVQFVIPMVNKKLKPKLEQVLPLAEYWVQAVETSGLSGAAKKAAAMREVINELKADGIQDISEGLVDTAIQMAWLKLDLKQKEAELA